MADIRIKDLTTTASSTASDDFIAVDGTTNGTRKLNAFSPTFGGNATVTGTLTVNGTGTNSIPNLSVTGIGGLNVSANFLTSANTLRFSDSAAGGQTWFMSPQLGDGVATNFAFYSNDGVTSTPLFRVSSAGVFRLPSTASSTTTSTGALVVGNGTSGGLGVGGSIYAGDNINSVNPQGKIQIQGTGNTTGVKEINLLRSDGGDACTIGLTGSAYNGVFLAGGLGNNEAFIYNAAPFRVFIGTAATNRFDFTSSQFKINPTTASTSTSSGALVVSGGVGVAGAINVGGSMKLNYLSTAGDPTALGVVQLYATTNTTSGAGGIEWKADAGGNGYGYRTLTVFDGVSAYDLYTQVRSNSASWTNSLILKSNGNATFSGSVQTSAPSGGTAAAWKLGTVATVSPTSPNRTIEVDIGGTIYYIHAKTTNN